MYPAFAIAFFSTLGSLYFSEVLHFVPCVLCWYQRIFMYSTTIILFVGILLKDKKNLPLYVLPLSVLGLAVSFYQNLLYYYIVPSSLSPCVLGVSCTSRFIHLFGFLDIPQLSFLSFLTISSFMLICLRQNLRVGILKGSKK